jgi:hypothetical protein
MAPSLLASTRSSAKAKKRALRTASGGFRYPSLPDDIIPEWWARIDRNKGAIIPE